MLVPESEFKELEEVARLFVGVSVAAGVFIKKYLKKNGIHSPEQIKDDDLRKAVEAYAVINRKAKEAGTIIDKGLFD